MYECQANYYLFPNRWQNHQSRKKTNNNQKGVWRISNNSKKDQDLERSGSFAQHLFEVAFFVVDVCDKTNDHLNLIELSRTLYQRPDQDK